MQKIIQYRLVQSLAGLLVLAAGAVDATGQGYLTPSSSSSSLTPASLDRPPAADASPWTISMPFSSHLERPSTPPCRSPGMCNSLARIFGVSKPPKDRDRTTPELHRYWRGVASRAAEANSAVSDALRSQLHAEEGREISEVDKVHALGERIEHVDATGRALRTLAQYHGRSALGDGRVRRGADHDALAAEADEARLALARDLVHSPPRLAAAYGDEIHRFRQSPEIRELLTGQRGR